MKSTLIVLSLFFSLSGWGKELSFQDSVRVPKVVLGEVLLQDLTQLYSDYYFEDMMIATKTEAKKSKKSWSENLRERLHGCTGIYRI